MAEYLVSQTYDIKTAVAWLDHLATEGAKLPEVQAAADQCRRSADPLQCAFDWAYDQAAFEEIAKDYQRTQTVQNILRTKRTNCYGYCTLIGAVLKDLKIPYYYVPCGSSPENVYHIYIESHGKCLDCTLGQPPEGANFLNRPKNGRFNECPPVSYKMPIKASMITVMNQAHNPINRSYQKRLGYALPVNTQLRTRAMNAIDPMTAQAVAQQLPQIIAAGKDAINFIKNLVFQIFGDPCKRGCDIKHPLDSAMRRACKAQCEAEQEREAQEAFQYALSLMNAQQQQAALAGAGMQINPQTLLILGGLGLAAYFITQ